MNNGYDNNGFNNQNDGMYDPNNGNMNNYNQMGGQPMGNDYNQVNNYNQGMPQQDMYNNQMNQPMMNNNYNQNMYGGNYQNNWSQPNNDMNYQNIPNPPSSNKTPLIALAIVVVLIVGGVVIKFAPSLFNKTEKTSLDKVEEKLEKEETSIMKGVKYDFVGETSPLTSSKYHDYLFSLTSTNKKFVNVSIPIKFYDADNVQVDSTTLYFFCVEADNKLYTSASAESNSKVTYKIDEENIEAFYSPDGECTTYKNKVTSKITKVSEGNYGVLITNGTNKNLEIRGLVLFYKNNKIVDADYISISSVDANGSAKEEVYSPYDSDYNHIEPDKIEFVLSRAEIVR